MKPPAKLCKAFPAVGVLVLLLLGITGPVYGDKKPKFVYVANSGFSDIIGTFQVTATAICGGTSVHSDCASPISISGSFTVDMTTGRAISGTMFMSDPSDIASSPLAVPFERTDEFSHNLELFFSVPGRTSQQTPSYVGLIFPFLVFPASYSGGPLCTTSNVLNCGVISGAEIGTADMSSSLFNSTMSGTNGGIATITSGSVTLTGSSGGSQGSGSVSGYAIDGTTGALSPVPGSPFAAGLDPHSVAVDPSNKFVYVTNQLSNNISAFAVNGTTGALSPVPGSPFAAGLNPDSVAVNPSGKFVYAANQLSNNVSAYTLNSATGALTPVTGSPFAAGQSPVSLAMDPLDRFVYVTNSDRFNRVASLSTYTIDSTTGALITAPGSPFFIQFGIESATFNPSGKYLYETFNFDPSKGVSAFSINGTTGALSGGSGTSRMVSPSAAGVDPSGKFLYVLDDSSSGGAGVVVEYMFDSTTGFLTAAGGSPVGAGKGPVSVAIDPSGKFIYVANRYSNDISGYTLDSTTGALTPIFASPFVAGAGPASVAIASASTVPFDAFKVKAEIDQDRKTSFRVGGFFTLGKGSNGINPLSEKVGLQVGTFTATIPVGSFNQEGRHEFEFEGRINDVDIRISIHQIEGKDHKVGKDFLFTAAGKGNILAGIANPVTVGLTIGDDEGSTTVKADIDK